MTNQPRIVFFGTTDFACAMLQTLVEDGYRVVGAISQPDRPQGRKKIIVPTPVHEYCIKHDIPCFQPGKLSQSVDGVLAFEPSLIVTCAYGQMIPESIIKYPSLGAVNIHPSLLPKYRGGAPMHHAIWAGDSETGVCLMEITKAMDAGKVYARITLSIGADETTQELEPRLKEASMKLLHDALPAYIRGELPGAAQDESGVVIARTISKEDEQIHFQTENLTEVYNHARALIDWPVSYGLIDGKRIKFYKVRKQVCEQQGQIGEVLGFKDHAMMICCEGGLLLVYELQPEGSKKMSADAYGNGAGRSVIGHCFE